MRAMLPPRIPFFIENFDEPGPVNISTGKSTSIRDLADLIAGATGFAGEIFWDSSKPDGQMIKIFAADRLKALGLSCDTPAKNGTGENHSLAGG